jgi:hypothetical protein
MSVLVFRVVMPCGLVDRYIVSKEHTASIFRLSPEGGGLTSQLIMTQLRK